MFRGKPYFILVWNFIVNWNRRNMNRKGITGRIYLTIEVSKLASNKIQIFASWSGWITTTFAIPAT
jgi:hypothetical protein